MFNFFNKNKQSKENLIISNNVSRLREIVKNFNDKNTNNTTSATDKKFFNNLLTFAFSIRRSISSCS